jgi:hypothetical protein
MNNNFIKYSKYKNKYIKLKYSSVGGAKVPEEKNL